MGELENQKASSRPPKRGWRPRRFEKWISEELEKAGMIQRVRRNADHPGGGATCPPTAATFQDALQRVDISNMPPETMARLKDGWKRYQKKGQTRQKPRTTISGSSTGNRHSNFLVYSNWAFAMGDVGAIEQMAATSGTS